MQPPFRKTELFGGAITVDIPPDIADVRYVILYIASQCHVRLVRSVHAILL